MTCVYNVIGGNIHTNREVGVTINKSYKSDSAHIGKNKDFKLTSKNLLGHVHSVPPVLSLGSVHYIVGL